MPAGNHVLVERLQMHWRHQRIPRIDAGRARRHLQSRGRGHRLSDGRLRRIFAQDAGGFTATDQVVNQKLTTNPKYAMCFPKDANWNIFPLAPLEATLVGALLRTSTPRADGGFQLITRSG